MSELEAGRELDKRIAEAVMGWKLLRTTKTGYLWYQTADGDEVAIGDAGTFVHPWTPSTDILHAWEIIEKLQQSVGPHGEEYSVSMHGSEVRGWTVQFSTGCVCHAAEGTAPTAPLAICHAALKAVSSPQTQSPAPNPTVLDSASPEAEPRTS